MCSNASFMGEHILTRSLEIDLPRETVFDFFADAGNLEKITPLELNFHIVTPQPIKIERGTLIDYNLRLHGIPMSWQTEITVWDPPYEFVDTQLRGPYSKWVHRHTFTELGPDRTLVEDEVRYRLPLEPLGDLAHFIIRSQLNRIFDHRQLKVAELLAKPLENSVLT